MNLTYKEHPNLRLDWKIHTVLRRRKCHSLKFDRKDSKLIFILKCSSISIYTLKYVSGKEEKLTAWCFKQFLL